MDVRAREMHGVGEPGPWTLPYEFRHFGHERDVRRNQFELLGFYTGRVSPTPLLLIVGDNDRVTLTDLALEAYQPPPQELLGFPGGHIDAYLRVFEATSGAALQWFTQHLMPKK